MSRSSEADEQEKALSDANALQLTDNVNTLNPEASENVCSANPSSGDHSLSSDVCLGDSNSAPDDANCKSCFPDAPREKNGKGEEEEGSFDCISELTSEGDLNGRPSDMQEPHECADVDMNISVSTVVTALQEVKSEFKNAVRDARCEFASTVSEVKNELIHVLSCNNDFFPGTDQDSVSSTVSDIIGDSLQLNSVKNTSEETPTNCACEESFDECSSSNLSKSSLNPSEAPLIEALDDCHTQHLPLEPSGKSSAEQESSSSVVNNTNISMDVNMYSTDNGLVPDPTQDIHVHHLDEHEPLAADDNIAKFSTIQGLEFTQDDDNVKIENNNGNEQNSISELEQLRNEGNEGLRHLLPTNTEEDNLRVQPVSAPSTPVPTVSGSLRKVLRAQGCQGRRVSFPEDDTRLISSYLEPVNPWQKMGGVTVEEIAAAYRASCERHRTQPLPGVLQQIKALPLGVGGRVECISLRGQRLEGGQCEGLEEIFRRVQFKILDLEGCSLDDDTAIPLFDMIEFYDSATQLNISCNSKIGFRGWQACARMLKRTPSVEYLDARNTNLNETNMPILGRALRLGARLHTLHLENCNLTGRPLIMLTAALKQNDTLAELYLAENRLGVNDCIQLGNLVRANSTLRVLDLRNNNVQDAGCGHICEGITEQQKQQLETEGSDSEVKKDIKGLNSLVLWNNHLTQQSAPHLASLLSGSVSMEMLNLGRNNLTSEGILRLKESLLRNRSLLRLGLQAARIADEGAVALAEYTADNVVIQQIDLRENPVRVAGLMALAHSLRVNSTITQLDLDSDPRTEPAAELAERHMTLQKEIKEYCQRNLTQSHLRDAEAKSKTSEDGPQMVVDRDRLSVSSVIRKVSLTCETSHKTASVDTVNDNPIQEEEKQKYVSPAPSPLPSPSPSPCASPSPSPVPSPLKNRFRVFRVQEASRSSSQSPLATTAVGSPVVCSSAPVSQSGRSMSAGDLSLTSMQPSLRPNRFSIGGRFTVTRVTEASGSCSLPSSSVTTTNTELTPPTGAVSSPKIVISSPVRVERGFSIEETSAAGMKQNMFFLENSGDISATPASSESMSNKLDSLPEGNLKRQINMSGHVVRLKSDSDSDDVFVESSSSNANNTSCGMSDSVGHKSGMYLKSSLNDSSSTEKDTDSVSSSELTDSGFLDDSVGGGGKGGGGGGGGGSVSPSPSSPHLEGDRDSLLSSSVDSTSQEDAGLGSSVSSSSNLQCSLPSVPLLPCSAQPPVQSILTEPLKRAPLAAMENGSFDSDSEDSEVTTQSSDSTHSDEVRITTEQLIPRPAWGLKQEAGEEKHQSSDASIVPSETAGTG